jgi:hypothetical protein
LVCLKCGKRCPAGCSTRSDRLRYAGPTHLLLRPAIALHAQVAVTMLYCAAA